MNLKLSAVSSVTDINSLFLREAIRLSWLSIERQEGGPFGAVVVRDQEIIGRGWNRVTSTNDPTAHAEVVAIRDACSNLGTFSLAGCQIYSSCEPCPLCLAAVYWARMDQLYYAATRDDAAAVGFDDGLFYEELAKDPEDRSIRTVQCLRDEAQAALQAWLKKEDRIPY